MQNLPALEVMRRAVRAHVCAQCTSRPEGSENLSPQASRPCEATCNVFVNLLWLRRIAHYVDSPTMDAYEHQVLENVCQHCHASPSAGDYCGDRATRRCALSKNVRPVIEVLTKLDRAKARRKVRR